VGSPGRLEEWARRVLGEKIAVGAVFLECRNRGCRPQRAEELAEDAVQHALTQAARIPDLAEKFASFGHFCNWVRTVAINHVRSFFRRRHVPVSLGAEDAVVRPAPEPRPDTTAVRTFMEHLPTEERRLLLLRYDKGLTLDELAEHFLQGDGRSANARRLEVRRRVLDILGRLRRHVEEASRLL
jgi:RNA polymerase sigma factor (sigma-70 family)